jgi:putative redox protein
VKAVARRVKPHAYTQELEIRHHRLTADEPDELGGDDEGPSPQELLAASLASCTAITIEMYAKRKEWDLGEMEVEVTYSTSERIGLTQFDLVLRLPAELNENQRQRLQDIASRCPVHRTLAGEVVFQDRVELLGGQSTI